MEEKRKRPVAICFGCKKPKEIHTHHKSQQFPDGDPRAPLCQACMMKVRRGGPIAFQIGKLKACTNALGGIEALIGFASEEEKKNLQDAQDHIKGLLSDWALEQPATEVAVTATGVVLGDLPPAKPLEELKVGDYLTAKAVKNGGFVLQCYTRINKSGKHVTRGWSGTEWLPESTNFPRETQVIPFTKEKAEQDYGVVEPPPPEVPKAKQAVNVGTEAKSEAKFEEKDVA